MGLEKFNAVHSFLSNTEDGDIIRGNIKTDNSVFATVKSAGKEQYLYKRTGFFGRLWQGIFASSGGATQRRQEAATLIKAAIGEIQKINESSKKVAKIVESIQTLISNQSKDFDTKSIRDKFGELAIYAQDITSDADPIDKLSVTETNEGAADEEIDLLNSIPPYEPPWEQGPAVDKDQNKTESAITIATETTIFSVLDFPPPVSLPELENLVTANEISALPAAISHAPVLETVSNIKEKNAFGLIPINNSLAICLSSQRQPLSVMHADAYIVPRDSEGIGLQDKINGKGSPSQTKTTEHSFSFTNLNLTRGTQRFQNVKLDAPIERDFYSATATVPKFEFKIENDLSPEESAAYEKSQLDYAYTLSEIYDHAFDALFESGNVAGKPIQTIALLPLAQNANQVRNVEIDAMVFSVRFFQKKYPGVKVAILTNSETKRSQIDTAFKTPSQEDNPQLTAADQALQ